MSKESLGVVSCEGCNGDAHIKRRSNGKKLLYLHCKSCGLDQRSGKVLQAKWQSAVDGLDNPQPKTTKPNIEWQPAEVSENDNEKSDESKSDNNPKNSTVKWLAGVGIAFAVLVGFGR